MAKKRSQKLVFIALIVIIAIGGLGTYGYIVMSSPKTPLDPSKLATAERADIARSVVATGKIEPIAKVEIKSKANGIIKALRVEVGDMVSAGQILAELDKENLAAQLREANAALGSAQANLKATEAEFEKNKLEAVTPEVSFARRTVERTEKLAKDGIIPLQELDDAQRALELLENKQKVTGSQLNVSQARISQALAQVAEAEAAVARAQEQYNNATIRSPINGMVISRDLEIGSPVSSILNMGSAATLVMVLGDIRPVYVRGKVDEADIGAVRLGQLARIKVETFKEQKFDGSVTQISPMGVEKDNVTSFEVKVSINNAGGTLRANMTANAEIVLEEHQGALIIPESAIIYDAQRNPTVEIPSANPSAPTASDKRPIKIGISDGSRTEVLEGLKDGEKVVLQ
ncbi:MAG: efflux RND transporter periplasmic adaptor subunit [Pyrinomonadaceae bacterium]